MVEVVVEKKQEGIVIQRPVFGEASAMFTATSSQSTNVTPAAQWQPLIADPITTVIVAIATPVKQKITLVQVGLLAHWGWHTHPTSRAFTGRSTWGLSSAAENVSLATGAMMGRRQQQFLPTQCLINGRIVSTELDERAKV